MVGRQSRWMRFPAQVGRLLQGEAGGAAEGESPKQVQRQKRKTGRRRKQEDSRKVQPDNTIFDEGLEVGSLGKLEDAGSGASRRLSPRVKPENAAAGEVGNWPLVPPRDGWQTQVSR